MSQFDKLNNFDVLHCRGKHVLAKAIMFLTKGKFSHTAFFIRIKGLPFIVDAQKDGFNIRSLDQWLLKYNYYFEVTRKDGLSVATKKEMERKTFEKVGMTAYDFESLLWRMPRKIITGKWKDKGEKEDDRMVCSEGAAYVYGYEDPEKLSPQAFYDLCMKSGHRTIAKRNPGQSITYYQ
jgi:hypothetical protein